MSSVQLNQIQARIKALAENIVLKDKVDRQPMLHEMTELNRQLTTQQQLELVMAIQTAPGLRFLAATGIRGDARAAMFARQLQLEKEVNR